MYPSGFDLTYFSVNAGDVELGKLFFSMDDIGGWGRRVQKILAVLLIYARSQRFSRLAVGKELQGVS